MLYNTISSPGGTGNAPGLDSEERSMKTAMLLTPVLLPVLLAAAVKLIRLKGKWAQRAFVASALIGALAAAWAALCAGTEEISLRWTEMLSVSFRVDGVSRLYLMMLAVIWPGAALYATEYLEHDGQSGRFFFFFGIVQGVLHGLAMSGNLTTFYILYEGMALTAAPLVLHSREREAVEASRKFLVHSLAGAAAALAGILLLAYLGGSGDFGAGRLADASLAGKEGIALAAFALMLIGFCAKAGMYPLHGWLPTAHPAAPAPASAVLSGVITKMGVLGVLRVIYQTAGAERLRGTWVQYVFLILSLLTILMGSTLALKETHLKRRLAYSSVSQVSYVLFGLFTMTKAGFIGAALHILFHSLMKNTLFMGAGAIMHRTGKTDVNEMNGLGRRMPWTYVFFTVASLGLVGIPPTGGFISKWQLSIGALETGIPGSWAGPAALLISAVLTAGYLLTFVIHGCFPGRDAPAEETCEAGLRMLLPMGVYAALTVLLGIFSGPIVAWLKELAEMML